MRFHFPASIKPILKNLIFSIVLEAFYPLYEAKMSNAVYVSITLKFFSGARGTSLHQWFNCGNEIQKSVFLLHPIEHGLNQYFSNNAGITSQWISLAAMKSGNNFPCLRGLQLLIKCCSGITPLMHCILTNRCPMLFSFQS